MKKQQSKKYRKFKCANVYTDHMTLCPWFSSCKVECKECPKCKSSPKHITPGCDCCDGCNGVSPFKVVKK
jgi:hypothetical protein